MQRPREATLAITYRCNSRCTMCNIWKTGEFEELPPEEYSKLPSSLTTINVTGGEPFLRSDIIEVLRQIHKAAPSSRIVISSNGMLTEATVAAVKAITKFHRRIGVGISIDGLEDVHDNIRGVEGGFGSAIETVKAVKSIGLKDLRLGMTIMRENSDQVHKVFQLSRELGVEFTATTAHNSEIYFKKTDNVTGELNEHLCQDLRKVINELLQSFLPKNWFRAYHLAGLLDADIRRSNVSRCTAGSRFFFMDPMGSVYPCIVMDRTIGNIKDFESLDSMLSSERMEGIRASVKRCNLDCWMVCNVRSLIVSHPIRPLLWAARNKSRVHFSRAS